MNRTNEALEMKRLAFRSEETNTYMEKVLNEIEKSAREGNSYVIIGTKGKEERFIKTIVSMLKNRGFKAKIDYYYEGLNRAVRIKIEWIIDDDDSESFDNELKK